MLTKIDKSKILKLRSEEFSYQAIHEELGFAVDTIMNVCRKEEERKIKGVEESQRENKNAEESQTQGVYVNFNSPIDALQDMTIIFDNIIKKGQLKAVERKEFEKRLESIREILKLEVDERIPEERADAMRERDKDWNKYLEQHYVEKEVVADLDSTIKERDTTIVSFRKIIEEKDDLIIKNQYDISQLRDSNQYLLWENNDLNEKNLQLHYHIENRLDTDVRQWREKLTSDQEALYVEKTNFYSYEETQQSNLGKLYFDVAEELKTGEMRKEKLNDQEGKIKKREAELDKNRTRMHDMLEESIKALKKREENVAELEKRLKIWIDEQKDELDAERKKINSEQPKHVILSPVSLSSEPVIQSGFPIIQSGGEPIVVQSSGEPVLQSGCSPVYYSGAKVFNKN